MGNLKLIDFDYRFFKMLNSLAGQSEIWDAIFIILAEYVLFLMIAGFALFILLKKQDKNRINATLQAFISAFIGRVAIVSLIRIFFYRSRPFVEGIVNQLVSHNPLEASFPSGHAVAMFAMAFSVLFFNARWGIFYIVLALISSISRVIVGVHFPMDILGGLLVGFLSAFIVKLVADFWFSKKQKLKLQQR